MNRMGMVVLVAAACVVLLSGCDVSKRLESDPAMRARIMDTIAAHAEMSSEMIQKLMANDATRALLVDGVMRNGPTMQALMGRMVRDASAVDGIIGTAVQDSAMREHVLTLFKGIQMAERK